MRRLVAIGTLLVAAVAVLIGAGGGSASKQSYRVDAIFDRTAALIPGQQVKIAGAPVGSVEDITLTPERKARVQMRVQEGFAPFRANARCIIRAEALIGEKFVQCDPGTPSSPALTGHDGGVPTVPLDHNTTPVEIDTILATFRRPYRERLRILLSEFGIGLAGRSDDLDAVIRRANPALKQANDLLRILDRERHSLGELVDGTDAALAELAGRRGQVQGFISHLNSVTQATASRRGDLQEAIRRLPPLLAELEPSANRLGSFAREARTPVRQLREAAPAVNALLGDVQPLSDAAIPALQRLSRTSRIGRRAVRSATPVAKRLAPAARELPDVTRTTARVVESLRDTGGVENLLTFVYYAAAAAARFDSISHVLPAFALANDCIRHETTQNPRCNGHFPGGNVSGGGHRTTERTGRRARHGARSGPRRQSARTPPSASPAPRAPGGRAPSRRPLLPKVPDLPKPRTPGPTGLPLLDYLLG
jgi:phospholipid/cholesterol/gamma-HCH transport system substrate-binding protein